MLIDGMLLLVYRNLVAAIDKAFLIWQVAFPAVLYICTRVYIFCHGGKLRYRPRCFFRYTYFISNCRYDWV